MIQSPILLGQASTFGSVSNMNPSQTVNFRVVLRDGCDYSQQIAIRKIRSAVCDRSRGFQSLCQSAFFSTQY